MYKLHKIHMMNDDINNSDIQIHFTCNNYYSLSTCVLAYYSFFILILIFLFYIAYI